MRMSLYTEHQIGFKQKINKATCIYSVVENSDVLPSCGWIFSPEDAQDTYWHWTEVDMLRRGSDAGRGVEMMLRGTGRCQRELQAAPRCIPSARVQPKHLMKSESAVRTEHFHKSNAPSVCHSAFPTPLVLPFLSLCCPSLGSFMWGQERWFSSTSDPGQVHCAAIRQPIHSHLTPLG